MVREGKKLDFDLELEQSLSWNLSYIDPNYDFLGNSLNYYLSSERMINQIKVMKIHLSARIGTAFEQYKDIYTNLRLMQVMMI